MEHFIGNKDLCTLYLFINLNKDFVGIAIHLSTYKSLILTAQGRTYPNKYRQYHFHLA